MQAKDWLARLLASLGRTALGIARARRCKSASSTSLPNAVPVFTHKADV